MKEHPILFSAEMVRALLAGRKSVTRRMSRQWLKVKAGDRLWVRETHAIERDVMGDEPPFRDGRPIKTAEDTDEGHTWMQAHYRATDPTPSLMCNHEKCEGEPCTRPWKPSIHMPRWASRITLEALEDARVERLQHITEEDAEREGLTCLAVDPYEFDAEDKSYEAALARALGPGEFTAKFAFMRIWSTLHAKPGERWEDNPEVVRVGEFRRVA